MAIERLIETTVLVDLLRGHEPARKWLDEQPQGQAAVSVITVAELLAGCRDRREQKTVEDELAFYPVIWDSETTSRLALEWYREFHLGHGVGFLDCLIGAAAHQHGLVLCTMNDRHFRSLPGLRTEQPY